MKGKMRNDRKYSGRVKKKIIFVFTMFLSIVIGLVVSASVFFRVDAVRVVGSTRYDVNEIVKKSGVKVGNNLFLCNTQMISQQLCESLPYLSVVEVQRKIPNEIILKVQEADACMEFSYKDSYLLMNKNGKVLEQSSELIKGMTILIGPSIEMAEVGQPVCFVNPNDSLVIKQILDQIGNNLDKITEINIADHNNLFLIFKGKIKVLLGTPDNLEYKIKTMDKIISEKISENEEGVLDISLASENGHSYFSNKKLIN